MYYPLTPSPSTAADRLYKDDERIAADMVGVASWFFVLADGSESKHPVPLVDLSWDEYIDEESGDAYYYNSITDVSQWDPPPVHPALLDKSTLVRGDGCSLYAPCRRVLEWASHHGDGHGLDLSSADDADAGGSITTNSLSRSYSWESQWFFEDDDNIMQGPVSLSDLHAWHLEGFLLAGTLLMRSTSGDEPMGDGNFNLGDVLRCAST